MKKANLLLFGLIASILVLLVLIGFLALPSLLQKKGPGNPEAGLLPTQEQAAKDAETQRQDKINCPTSLGVYYIVDRKSTESFADDDLFVAIRNPDARTYTARLYLNGKPEGETALIANSSTRILSPTLTDWWRAGKEKDSNSFPVELSIPGCSKTLSELMPTLPLSQKIIAGGGGGGGSEGGGRSAQTSPVLDITMPPDHLPD
jgi:hypothetical protein